MNWTVASKLLLSFVDTFYLFGSIATHSNKRNSMLNGNRMFDSCTIGTARALMNSFYSIFFLPILFTFFAFILKYSILVSYMCFFFVYGCSIQRLQEEVIQVISVETIFLDYLIPDRCC